MSATTKPLNQQCVTTVGQAFTVLGITGSISDEEEIHAAFRKSVRLAADGTGGYSRDMDLLVQAKDFLLTALARVREQASRDRARKLEQQDEQEQKRRKRDQEKAAQAEREQRKQEQQEEGQGEPPRLEGPVKEQEDQEKPPSQAEPKPGEVQEAQAPNEGDASGSSDPIETTLKTITAQLAAMEQDHQQAREVARKREKVRAQARMCLLANLDELERVVRLIRITLESEESTQS